MSSGSGGLRKCYYCEKHGHIQSNCPSQRLKSPSEKTSSERVPSEKKVSYEKQTLLQEENSSNYLEEKSNYDLFLSKAELASEKFDGSISICPLPDDTKVYIPVT